MRADFYRPDSPDLVAGVARWDGRSVRFEAEDGEVRAALQRIFRATPLAVDDPSLLAPGSAGPVVLPPGTLRWFQAAARGRATGEGLGVRLVPERADRGGWDPAGAYIPLIEAMEREVLAAARGREGSPETG